MNEHDNMGFIFVDVQKKVILKWIHKTKKVFDKWLAMQLQAAQRMRQENSKEKLPNSLFESDDRLNAEDEEENGNMQLRVFNSSQNNHVPLPKLKLDAINKN